MPLSEETVNKIVDSHDELHLVCQSLFAVVLKNDLLGEVDGLIFAQGVKPGFAERADGARRLVTRERIVEVRDAITR